jgi:hypothetical protein
MLRSSLPFSYAYSGAYPLSRTFHDMGGDSGFTWLCIAMFVVQLVVSVL